MEFQTYVSMISSPVQIAFLDLVLGADNAFIIALICRTLPRYQRRNVMIIGTGAALLLRIVLTALAGALLFAPVLRLIGGLVLILIAISLTDELDVGPIREASQEGTGGAPRDRQAESEAFWDAILVVVLADGIMSLDNTVALAAVADGNVLYLILGLLLSVPTLVFGSWLLSELLGQTPFLAKIAMAVLAWIAGQMAVSDPLIADWIKTTAPALVYGVPLGAVVFVMGKAAFRPVVVPLAVEALLIVKEAVDPATEIAEPATDLPSAHSVPEADRMPISHEGQVPAVAAEPPDADPTVETPPVDDRALVQPPGRPLEERLVIGGLIALFIVAAGIISSAIYFGGATF